MSGHLWAWLAGLVLAVGHPGGAALGADGRIAAELGRPRISQNSGFVSASLGNTNAAFRHTTFEGMTHGAFGYALAGLGDMDRDGFGDIAIAAPRFGEMLPDAGRVLLFHGSAAGIGRRPGIVFDGPRAGMQFGRSLSEGVDLDHDGFPDFLGGATKLSGKVGEAGGVYLFRGERDFDAIRQTLVTRGDGNGMHFGASVSIVGDVNGDGWADALVGAPEARESASDEGAAFLFFGSARGFAAAPDWTCFGGQEGAAFGAAVAGVGDLNQDGFDDVAIGAPHVHRPVKGAGRIAVFFGSRSGLHPFADWSFSGSLAREGVGGSIALRGDLNGDGNPDLVVGAPGNGEKSGVLGRVYVFLGPFSSASRGPDQVLEGLQAGSGFGSSVAILGDVTGEGTSSLLVGAPFQRNDIRGQGRVCLYVTGKPESPIQPRCLFDGPFSQSRFGWTVGRAGDVDGDGLADFLIGSPYLSDGTGTAGRVDLIYGSRSSFVQPEHFVAVTKATGRPLPSPALLVTNLVEAGSSEAADVTASRAWRWAGGIVAVSIGIAALLVAWIGYRQRRAARLAIRHERERLARDLHDNVAPELTRLALLDASAASGPARDALQSVGELVWATNPRNDPLEQFVAYLGDYVARFLEPTDLRLDLDLAAVPAGIILDARVRQHLFSTVKEALHNIVKHSGAQTVWLSARLEGTQLDLGIRDDGRGFDPARVRSGANGLDSMRARIADLGGTLRINSTGQGTEIRIGIKI